MTPLVVGLVLFAALLHASWNAMAKSGGAPQFSIASYRLVSALCCLPLLFYFPIPLADSWSMLLAIFMVLAFFEAAMAAISILWVRNFYISPKLSQFSKHLTEGVLNDAKLAEWTANAYSVSIDNNESVLGEKAKLVKISLAGLITEGVFLGLLILSTQL